MFYVTYSDYDDQRMVARFTYEEDANYYAKVMNLIYRGGFYDVDNFEDVPLNPATEGVVVLHKGLFSRHFRELETAEKWISERKIPANYTIYEPHTSHQDT